MKMKGRISLSFDGDRVRMRIHPGSIADEGFFNDLASIFVQAWRNEVQRKRIETLGRLVWGG